MDAPRIRRLPPGVWTAVAWCAGLAYSLTAGIRLPGEVRLERAPRYSGLADLPVVYVLASLLVAVAGSVLVARRPLPALALLLAGSTLMAMGMNSTEITFAQFLAAEVALTYIAATRPRRTALAAMALTLGTLAGYAAVRLVLGFHIGTSTELIVALTAVIAWLAGDRVQQDRERVREREAQAVTAERLRIARELHDSVAHSLGIIAIQAGAAKLVIDTRPTDAREALGAIEDAGRNTLAGLRRVLGALRRPEPAMGAGAPGLDELEGLAAEIRAAGVQVDLHWSGRPCALPADVERAAFRIVQEAVTNVLRHSGSPRCRVSIGYGDGELAIEIVDPGGRPGHRAGQRSGSGYGLVGIRERVGLLNGDFTAGSRPEGGFRVAARLPTGVR